jgi:protein-tyrosine-phosphatase
MPTLLLVCAANRCRSPLAAALLTRLLHTSAVAPSAPSLWRVESAGLYAEPGLPATPYTVTVAREIGLDLAAHRARRIDDLTLADYALIVTMEESQAHALAAAYPGRAAAISALGHLLNLRMDVEDPTGQGLHAHRALRSLLERYLAAALPRLPTPDP